MTFFKKILPLLSLLTIVGCGPGGNSFELVGTLEGQEAGELYIYNLSSNYARFDTLKVEDGKFEYKGQADEVTPYILLFPNAKEQVIFIEPGKVTEYTASATDLKNYQIDGCEDNILWSQFVAATDGKPETQVIADAKNFIKSYPESAVSAYLETRYALNRKADLTSLPNLTLKTKDSKSVKLWSKKSTYTLTVYWASWMMSSYDLTSKLRTVRNRYNDKAKFRVVAISLDNERNRWEDDIRIDSINGIEHYCDFKAWESPAVKAVQLSDIPRYYLINSQHKILRQGTDLEQMLQDVDKYLIQSEHI